MSNADTCPVCGNTDLHLLVQPRDFLVTQTEFSVFECRLCELGITIPRPSEAEIAKYYQSTDYISHSGGTDRLFDVLYRMIRKYTLGHKRRLIEGVVSAPGKIIDIGCGTGDFLAVMQANGWSVTGVEPDANARETAGKTLGETVLSPADWLAREPETVSVITLWHVLEHIHDPKQMLHRIFQSLSPDGLLVLALPNYQSHDAGMYGADWAAWDVPRHLFHFSRKAVQRLVGDSGKLVKVKRMLFDPFYISLLSERKVRRNGRIPRGLLIGIYSWWMSVIRIRNSSSLIYIIRPIRKMPQN